MPDQPSHAETRTRDAERRRSERVLLVVPLEVAWERPDGSKLKDQAETELVSAHGALLRLKSQLAGVKELELIRKHPPMSTRARVVNTFPVGADGFVRVAVELAVPSHAFWGLVIPEAVKPTAAPAEAESPKVAGPPKKRKIALRVPIRIRTPEGAVEVCKTENLSKEEARFLDEKDYALGAALFVAAPYTRGEEPLETKAVVEAIEGQEDSPKKLYVIRFDRAAKKDSS